MATKSKGKEPEKKTTAVAKRAPEDLAASDDRPEYLRHAGGGEGLELLTDSEDVIMPRINICQSMTPQRMENNPAYIADLEEGQFFDNVTGEIFGDEIVIIPVRAFKSRIKFAPRGEGKGIQCRSANAIDGGSLSTTCATCPNHDWRNDPKLGRVPPSCTLFYNYVVMIRGTSGRPGILSFKGTGIKAARAFNSMMKLRKGNPPAFAGAYKATTQQTTNDFGTFYVPVVSPAGWAKENEFNGAKNLYESLEGKAVIVQDDEGGEDAGEATDLD